MLELAGGPLDVARPLEGKLLPGPRAGPDRHGELDRLEVEVEAREGQGGQVGRGLGDAVGGAAAGGLPDAPVQRR